MDLVKPVWIILNKTTENLIKIITTNFPTKLTGEITRKPGKTNETLFYL